MSFYRPMRPLTASWWTLKRARPRTTSARVVSLALSLSLALGHNAMTGHIDPKGNVDDAAGSLALFLTERAGSCLASWSGRLTAVEQRQLFGRFLGKGRLVIDGATETLEHHRKVCFGLDSECTAHLRWRDL